MQWRKGLRLFCRAFGGTEVLLLEVFGLLNRRVLGNTAGDYDLDVQQVMASIQETHTYFMLKAASR